MVLLSEQEQDSSVVARVVAVFYFKFLDDYCLCAFNSCP